MSLERCTEIMTKCFNTLQVFVVDRQHGRDFASACGYFLQQVNWSTDKANPVSAAFMPLMDRQAVADGDEVSTLLTLPEASREAGRTTMITSLTLAATFHSKFQESTD
jgi:hypothetical protein